MTEPSKDPSHGDILYCRVKIRGTLRCDSDLHVGDGGTRPWADRKDDLPQGREAPDIETNPSYHSVCLAKGSDPDQPGRPYLPGSSLRGALRSQLAASAPLCDRLFGLVRKPEEGPSQAGCLRIYDAFLEHPPAFEDQAEPPYWSTHRRTAARHAIAIDPLTGTAEHNKLFSHEIVPAGSAFAIEIEADNLTQDDLACVLGLLQRWDGSLWSALGGKRGKGWGRVCWLPSASDSVRVLTQSGLKRWLEEDDRPLDGFFEGRPPLPAPIAASAGAVSVAFRLLAEGPMLVNEPGYRRSNQGDDGHFPTHEHSRRPDGQSIIPGKSLIGMVRGRARRILATIAHQHFDAAPAEAVSLAQQLIREVFGDAGHRGALWISDAEAGRQPEDHPVPHVQFFNAIDRFTGGVKGPKGAGALFNVNACTDGSYHGQLLLETERLQRDQGGTDDHADWWKGLLLFVARDAIEGDLAVGWGKSKGYGTVRLVLGAGNSPPIGDWSQLLAQARSWGDPAAWAQDLHATIGARLIRLRAPQARDNDGGNRP